MRLRPSVDVESEPKGRLAVAAAARSDSAKLLVEQAPSHEIDAELPESMATDPGWLESDLSRLGGYEPYQWQDGELDEGEPLIVEHVRGGSFSEWEHP